MMGGKPDTSPKIAQYDKSWGRNVEVVNNDIGWCITEWYEFNQRPSAFINCTIVGYIGNAGNQKTFQYYYNTNHGWYYFINNDNPSSRVISTGSSHDWKYISFSIDSSKLDDAYAYWHETGQIFFAGKNTPYYGYKNINDMPTA